ncbi:dihydrodipicolinate synthase family protein [Aestuariibaculum lutulentum]|uniref:Dihydrodipicolinate synthase family protein n=1 Tax=Aestuariibaculum lutulentum TaxID=2920935 RepID=A0ABS9RFH1_9FLAO|nr:dihydrodipicolinate synthase family protein [Aestuariibaculum lutulentum]MCH4551703.1 dihydrodipicolinate synthase family protein [Aestuariibaculum lutulentum]
MQKRFSGVVVPMITPLNKDLTVDLGSVSKLMKLFSQNNIHPLVLGTTGESSSVNEMESLRLLDAAVEAKTKTQCIYAGLVGNQVDDVVHRGNKYIELGADCVVATLPSYYGLSSKQMILFYKTLADNISGPVMMYNIKATTQMSIPLDVIEELSEHPNIWGLKDSERDEKRLETCVDCYKNNENFSFFCGWGAQGASSLKLGADGIVPSTGNYVPEMYNNLYKAALDNDWETCLNWQKETDRVALEYQKDKTLGESLAFLKLLMSKKGLCNKTMMPPLTEVE